MFFPSPRFVFYLIVASAGLLVAPLIAEGRTATLLADGLLVGVALLDAFALLNTGRCTVTRVVSDILSLGAENPVVLRVENHGRLPLRIDAFDDPPASFSTDASTLSAEVAPLTYWEGTYRARPSSRGDFSFGGVRVRYRTALGLMTRLVRYDLQRTVHVYPNVMEIRKHQLLSARQHLELMGIRRQRGASNSTEFDSLREYQPDDEPRHIDWKATARQSRTIVRHYEVERSQNVLILLDVGRLMASRLGDMTKLDHAINACLMLTYVAAQGDDRVGVLAFDSDVAGYLKPGKGKTQMARVAHFLYPLQARRTETDYRRAFTYLASMWKRRALIVLFTDLVDPEASEALLQDIGLLRPRHMVLCVALSDYELDQVLADPPQTTVQMYEQTAARMIRRDRNAGLAGLRARGVLSLDASPNSLTPAVINRYIALKRGGW